MAGTAPSLAVVVAPDTAEEAGALFAALLSQGFHPTMDYGEGPDGPQLANFPILAPLSELAAAQAYVRGLRVKPPLPVHTPHRYDLPPPEPLKRTIVRAFAGLGSMLLVTAAITAVVLVLQLLARLFA